MPNIPTTERAGISCIPPEILGEIFIRCLPVDSTSQNTRQLLGSVCRLWRELVPATPALWASLDIRCNADAVRPSLPVIRTHLQRSGAHPLSFILHTTRPQYPLSDNPYLLSVLMTLAAARQRWENVEIRLYSMTQDILDLITQGDTPLLRSIQCGIYGYEGTQPPIPLCMLDRSPRLESFQWENPGTPLLPLTDTQLTSLWLPRTSLSVSECITILRLSPRLSSAVLHVLNPPRPSTTPRLTHATLCTLTVTGDHSDMLLAALTLPALLDLCFSTGITPLPLSPAWTNILPAFLERSEPKLHKLTISKALGPTFLRILTLTPHLRSLVLTKNLYSAPPTAFIRALHPKSQPGAPLCPHLQILSLSGVLDCPDGLWTEMLRARWGTHAQANGVTCLKSAHIGLLGGNGVHDRDRADMEGLRAEGFQGTIFWG